MADRTDIIDFWRANRAYWLPITDAEKVAADAAIRDAFWSYVPEADTLAGRVIYLDQFSRHFQRLGLLTEEGVAARRARACGLVEGCDAAQLAAMDEVEILFALMPFKHLGRYEFIFRQLHRVWLPANGGSLLEHPTLQRFYMDTYKKAYTLERVGAQLQELRTSPEPQPYDAAAICDYYPERYKNPDEGWFAQTIIQLMNNEKSFLSLREALKPYKKAIVSLSGGVDSMVMLIILKRLGADVRAVHIVYGNRAESEDECRFITEYCRRLEVPLSLYRIPWLRRGAVEREFYEDMTRQLRFWVYQCVKSAADTGSTDTPILLGHIQDDVVENIWTNIANCTHLGDLKKMRSEEVQMGVRLARPFLGVEKRDIYAAAELLAVPYLKNTTPSWSNRGKFREHFHAATVAQFGAGIDARLIAFAEAMQRQTALVQRFVYEPVYKSWADGTVNITTAVEAELDAAGWTEIFEHLCHKRLDRGRPSVGAVREFCRRLRQCKGGEFKMHLSGELMARVWPSGSGDGSWRMKLITQP